jgi:hypothetical protein
MSERQHDSSLLTQRYAINVFDIEEAVQAARFEQGCDMARLGCVVAVMRQEDIEGFRCCVVYSRSFTTNSA